MQKTLISVHLWLAAFFLPIAVMFAATGALYTVSIKGSYVERSQSLELAQPLSSELSALTGIVERALNEAGVEHPSGAASIKKAGTSFELEWTGASRDVLLKPTADPLRATLVIKETTPWRHMVQLHKAKGSEIAKGISVLWAIGLVIVLLSGLLMAWNVPTYRRTALTAGGFGLVTFAVYMFAG
ncbi:MAG: PepSY domain-containing protein [Gammaproteobacteria bacterium]